MQVTKPLNVTKQYIYDAYLKVKSNKGSGCIDYISLSMFHKDYKNHLFTLWNSMYLGNYMPTDVKFIGIPQNGKLRILSIDAINDLIYQTVVKKLLELELKSSFRCRRRKLILDTVPRAGVSYMKYGWIIDLNVQEFCSSIPHNLLLRALEEYCSNKWILLYIQRWLLANFNFGEETIPQSRGIPRDSVIGPVLSNLYLRYSIEKWLSSEYSLCPFETFTDATIIHFKTESEGLKVMIKLQKRLAKYGLELTQLKKKLVYDKHIHMFSDYSNIRLDFLDYNYKSRNSMNGFISVWFINNILAAK